MEFPEAFGKVTHSTKLECLLNNHDEQMCGEIIKMKRTRGVSH